MEGGKKITIIAIAAAGITSVLLALQLRGLKGEYASYLVMVAGVFIFFFYGVGKLENILEALKKVQSYIRADPVYLTTLLKWRGLHMYYRICF